MANATTSCVPARVSTGPAVRRRGAGWLTLVLAMVACCPPAWASEPAKPSNSVKLALPDRGFRHAGYYVALEKGYFKDAGLEVVLEESSNPIAALVKGSAAFAVGGVEALIYRANGLPVVSVAAVFQHSPVAVAARPEKAIDWSRLAGNVIYREQESPMLEAFLKSQGINADWKAGEAAIQKFTGGLVNAVLVRTADERVSVQNAQFAVAVLSPRLAGVDFYGDILLTRAERIETDKKSVLAFREALARGWKDALVNVNETLDLIDKKYPTGRPRSLSLQEAALVAQLIAADSVDIGHQDTRRWAAVEKVFLDAGYLKSPTDVKQFIFDPGAKSWPAWVRYTLLIGTPAFAVIMLLAWRLRVVLRQLRVSRDQNERSLGALKAHALWDTLSELHNRQYFEPNLERELVIARRRNDDVALVMVDIDLLKRMNDRWGEASGDAAVKLVAKIIRKNLKEEYLACRYEDAEMVVLMPRASVEAARQFAEKLREAVESTPIKASDEKVYFTVSAGVSLWPDLAATPNGLIDSARKAMYAAKSAGRNRVTVAK